METTTVESLCNLLARSRLLPSHEIKVLYQGWQREGGASVKDAGRFGNWLVDKQYVTRYQADALLRGRADHFFFNEYKLLDCIGKGSMAGVYKAVHRLGQVVAIKVLPPSKVKDPEAFGRFQREARLAQRLKHANVVRTFQTGKTGALLYYLVMEYLEGETLAEIIQARGKLPPLEAAQLIYQVLLGLQHIHDQNMVHRDLSPANLMVLPPPSPREPGVVKILDIGLGKAVFDEGTAANDVNLTREDSVLGSPDYMAPEQARSAHKVDIRADLYSLGCVLYHAIAGQPPFPDKNAVRKIIRHASEQAQPLAAFNPAVKPGLQQIVDTMLAKDPNQRYATPGLAAAALKIFLEAETVQVVAPPLAALVPAYQDWLDGAAPPEAIPMPAAVPANVDVELVQVVAMPAPASSRRLYLLLGLSAGGALTLLCGGAVAYFLLYMRG